MRQSNTKYKRENTAFIYVRLSRDDNLDGDSYSISNQKKLLTKVAKEKGAVTAALLGKNGGKIKTVVDYPVIVPCNTTARIQECHIMLIHIMCEIVEEKMK